VNASIAGFLRESAQRHPDAPCLISGDTTLTWGEVDRTADAFAAGLVQRGLHAGDRVALLLGNCAEFVIAYYGSARAGLVTVPLNPAYTSAEVAVLLADSGARMLIAQPSTVQVGVDAATALPGCEVISTTGPEWADILRTGEGAVLAEVAASPDTLALLLFTAGTSGRPKGAMLTHGALRENIAMLLALTEPPAVVDDDVVLIVLPMFHVYGLNTALGLAVAAGATVVLSDRFDPPIAVE
jgi:long-chain acyl-CoA synthetase